MKLSDLSVNWPKTIALITLTFLLFWGYGCPSRVPSLVTDGKNITRPELQIELDTIIATAEFRLAELDRQDQFRDIIFKNAMLMVEGGTMNPIGIITLLAGLYGISRGAKDLKDKVKKKTNG
ncbi:hypothetical protein KAR91_83470 [Candidatus Pacearchaeota archaeon]|nr:hypothetical protein [Candidatus Pacearchaeota archaeon]